MSDNETAALVVALSAQVSKFQKDMEAANGIADKTVRKIEDRFKNANISIGKLASGTILGNLLSDPISAAINKVQELGEEFSKTATLAKFLQTSIARVQELSFAAALKGVGFDTFRTESQQFLRNAEEAKRALDEVGTLSSKQINRVENDFARLFKANGVSITDNSGELLKFDELLMRAADLVRNAKTELDKVKITEMLGLSREWVRVLEQGSEGFREAAKEARAAGAVVSDELIKKAKEFDHAWDEAIVRFKARFKQFYVESRNFFSDLWTSVMASFGDPEAIVKRIAYLEEFLVKLRRSPAVRPEDIQQYEEELALMRQRLDLENQTRIARGEPALRITVRGRNESDEPTGPKGDQDTVVPFKLKNKETEVDREIKQIDKRRVLLDAETASIGKNTYEKERAKTIAELLQTAEAAGITVTEEVRNRIERVANAYALASQRAEEMKNKFEGLNDAVRYFGNETGNFLDLLTDKTKTLSDVGTAALRSFTKELQKAALTGEGTFAKLFGTNSTTGGVGGLFGLVSSALGGGGTAGFFGGSPSTNPLLAPIGHNASGSDNWRGGLTEVGENGPELVNLPRGAQVIPNDVLRRGGGGAPQVYITNHVDASGADIAAISRLTVGLARVNQSIESRAVAALSNHRMQQG